MKKQNVNTMCHTVTYHLTFDVYHNKEWFKGGITRYNWFTKQVIKFVIYRR